MLPPKRPPRASDFDDRFDGTDCPACGDEYDPALVSVLWPDMEASRDVFPTNRLCLFPADGDIRTLIDSDPDQRYDGVPVLIAIEHTVSDDLTSRTDDAEDAVELETDTESDTERESESERTPHPPL